VEGALVPAVLLPRFTGLVGPGSYATAPIRVVEFSGGQVTFWRGPLVGGAGLEAYIEEATVPDAEAGAWTEVATSVAQPVTADDAVDNIELTFTKEWMRVRIELANHPVDFVVGLTVYMTGVLVRRVPPMGAGSG
jgi:hypothetical protein